MGHSAGSLTSRLQREKEIEDKQTELDEVTRRLERARDHFGESRDLLAKAAEKVDNATKLFNEVKEVKGPYLRAYHKVDADNTPDLRRMKQERLRLKLEEAAARELVCEFDEQSVTSWMAARMATDCFVAADEPDRRKRASQIKVLSDRLRQINDMSRDVTEQLKEAYKDHVHCLQDYYESQAKRNDLEDESNRLRGELQTLRDHVRHTST